MSKERPILMSAPMVNAILAGRKSQTRRVMKPQPQLVNGFYEWAGAGWDDRITRITPMPGHSLSVRCPYGVPGDYLWCREGLFSDALGFAMYAADGTGVKSPTYDGPYDPILSRALWPWLGSKRRTAPAIFMPRALSRITLEITEVRVERVQNISEEDAAAEGVSRAIRARLSGMSDEEAIPLDQPLYGDVQPTHRNAYATLWDSINGAKYPWSSNPWCWVVRFQRVTP